MPQAAKYTQVMTVIEQRIRQGDYLLNTIPGERRIAEETGVSHMTARKAVQALLDRKVLIRRPNGMLDVHPRHNTSAGSTQIVLLYPAYSSTYLTQLRQIVSQVAEQHGLGIRPVQYVHWDDPVVHGAVFNPSGAVIIPSSLDLAEHTLAALRENNVVALDGDLSDQGVPSIRLFPDAHITKVFEHLRKLGHSRIDCISTHCHHPEIHRRVRLWREWIDKHNLKGELWDNPAPSFDDPTPFAYKMVNQHLKHGSLKAKAFVGTTFTAAVGAMRACWEHGLVVGKDVSVSAVNVEPPARFMTPSVTGLDTPDLSTVLKRCFDWFANDDPWKGAKRLEPRKATFLTGESTGPA